jgi:DNA-binding SARP family transcriptional activator
MEEKSGLQMQTLGGFNVAIAHSPLLFSITPRLQALLAYLAIHKSTPQSRTHIAFMFWPDSSEEQAHTNLRKLIFHLRRELPGVCTYIHFDSGTLQFYPSMDIQVDHETFISCNARVDAARKGGDHAAEKNALEEAIAAYHGEFMTGYYEEWIVQERERLKELFMTALHRMVSLLENLHRYEEAVQYAHRLLQQEPLHEENCLWLMRLHNSNHDRNGAIQVYLTYIARLEREMGEEPGPRLKQAYENLVKLYDQPRPSATLLATMGTPLIGRSQEMLQLQSAWLSASKGKTQMVLISGEPGIGKTRLAAEMLEWVQRMGVSALSATCYEGEGRLAYAPVIAWLRARPIPQLADIWLSEAARLLPEILLHRPDLPHLARIKQAWQRQHLFEALARMILAGNKPLCIFLDNLHWADRDTLEWLHFLLRFDTKAPLLVLAAARLEGLVSWQPAARLVNSLRQEDRLIEIELVRLTEDETSLLGMNVLGNPLNHGQAELLYHETEGNPLFVIEFMRAGLPEFLPQELNHPFAGPDQTVPTPPKVLSVIAFRLGQLTQPAKHILDIAAVFGRKFRYEMLLKASGYDDLALAQSLDELWQRRLIREQPGGTYDFSHDKIRESVYARLSMARRKALHRRAGEALESIDGADLDRLSPIIAAHFEKAGMVGPAAKYLLWAGRAAKVLYANQDARLYFERALSLTPDHGELYTEIIKELADIPN